MDKNGVDVQVLSLTAPGVEQLEIKTGVALARETNNHLYRVIKDFPDRFIGFTTLAPKNPLEAAV